MSHTQVGAVTKHLLSFKTRTFPKKQQKSTTVRHFLVDFKGTPTEQPPLFCWGGPFDGPPRRFHRTPATRPSHVERRRGFASRGVPKRGPGRGEGLRCAGPGAHHAPRCWGRGARGAGGGQGSGDFWDGFLFLHFPCLFFSVAQSRPFNLLVFPFWSSFSHGPKRLTFYFWVLWASEFCFRWFPLVSFGLSWTTMGACFLLASLYRQKKGYQLQKKRRNLQRSYMFCLRAWASVYQK